MGKFTWEKVVFKVGWFQAAQGFKGQCQDLELSLEADWKSMWKERNWSDRFPTTHSSQWHSVPTVASGHSFKNSPTWSTLQYSNLGITRQFCSHGGVLRVAAPLIIWALPHGGSPRTLALSVQPIWANFPVILGLVLVEGSKYHP